MEPILVFNKGRYLFLYYRQNGKLVKKVEREFYPYFYVEKENGSYNTIDGKKAKKVVVDHPKLVPEERKKYEENGKRVYEADIVYTWRYTIDNFGALADAGKVWDNVPIRYCFIDLEAKDSLNYKNTPQPIVCFTLYDNYTRTYYTAALGEQPEYKVKGNWKVAIFDSEEKLIDYVLTLIRKLDPDLILAWNVRYDINYLVNRALKLGIDINKLARDGDVIVIDKEVKKIFGRLVIDYKELFAELIKLDSYSLENVAKELGLSTQKIKKFRISDMTLDELLLYNKTDVQILVEIEKNYRILRFWDEVRRVLGLAWNDFYRTDVGLSNKRIIDTYLLRLAKKRGIVLPTTPDIEKYESYRGGRVLEPSTGIFENVVVFDVKSTYPNIIRTYNISFETLSEDGEILTPLTHRFKKHPRGILAELADQLIELRNYYKKKMKETDNPIEKQVYDMRQQAIKVILNSAYGVFGCQYFRLYRKEVAESITAYARELLSFIIEKAVSLGYKVIYGDTDSIFIMFGKDMGVKQIYEEANELLNKLNESLSEFARKWNVDKHYHELEFKTIFKRVIFYGDKKAYVGYHVWNEGEWSEGIIKKGGIGVKSDSARITRKVYDEMFRMLLVEGKSVKEVKKYVEEIKEKIIRGEIPIEDLVFRRSFDPDRDYKNKEGQKQIKGLQNAIRLGLVDNVVGEKIAYIYVADKSIEVIGVPESKVELLKQFPLDYKRNMSLWFGKIDEILNSLMVKSTTLDDVNC